MSVSIEAVGTFPNGSPLHAATITGPGGLVMRVLELGAIVQSLTVPDRSGVPAEVVLGHDDPHAYLTDPFYLGAMVGRVANRIGDGRFVLDGMPAVLTRNLGRHHLHGGEHGFHRAIWSMAPFDEPGRRGVVLMHVSPHGTDGYPGTLATTVRYAVTDDNAWVVDVHAVTDRPTVVNPTQHAYFNLSGRGDIRAHRLTIAADRYLPQDAERLPTGIEADIAGTAYDLRQGSTIADLLARPVIAAGGGLDHSFVVHPDTVAVVLADPSSGRTLTVTTTSPVVHCYTGNVLDGRSARSGMPLVRHAGMCLETQHHPDAPRHANFPAIVLRPGETFTARTLYAFGVTDRETQ